MKEKIKKVLRKGLITIATVMMVFTSSFNSMLVHAATDNPYFEVNKADEVIAEAQKHLGKPYVWGAAGPNSFDCSGFASYVFKQVGLKFNADRFTTNSLESYLDGLSATSYRYSTSEGNPSGAKRGDVILYYDADGEPIHMGIYMGNGQIIHCADSMPSGPQKQVMISNVDALSSKHGSSLVTYKVYRVFTETGGIQIRKTDEFGNPLAGVTFKITMPNGTERNVVTNSNGIWDSDEQGIKMSLGTHQYQEISTKEGYILDSTVRTFTVKAGVKASENVVVVTNKEPSAQIKVIKTNTNKDRVAKATFNIYAREQITNKAGTKVFYSKDQLVDTITTNDSGEATSKNIPLGNYRVVETQVPDKYILNTNVFNVELKYKDQVTELISSSVTVVNEEQQGKIELKKDFDTSLVNGNTGDATLEGNEYMLSASEKITNAAGTIIYYEKNQMVSTKKTNANGEIEWDNLPLGKYSIEEIKTNSSLQFDYAGQTVSKTLVNKNTSDLLNMQKIQIFKTSHEGGSGVMDGLEGVEFTFKLQSDVEKYGWNDAKTYDVITTGKDGYAETRYLPYGVYHVKETKSPTDVIPAPDFTVSITKNYTAYEKDKQVRKINVNNAPLSAQVKLIKVDADTGDKVILNSASFKIKNSKGEYVVQKVAGIKIDTFTTNSKNQIVSIFGKDGEATLPLKLKADTYVIEEIKVPSGFLQLESPVTFEIKDIRDMEMDEDQDPIITVKVKNKQPKGRIEITKTDKTTQDPLMDVEYTLTAKKDIISAVDGSILFKAGEVVKKDKTNAEGKIIIEDIYMGEYTLKESLTNENYVLSEEVHDVIFKQEDMTTKVYSVGIDVTNIAPTGKIHLVKTDKATNELLSGVIYQLKAKEDIISLDGRNTVLYKAGEPVSVDISENGQYMTNELGEINIAGLPLGKYLLKEEKQLDAYYNDFNEYEIDLTYDESEKIIYTKELALINSKTIVEISKSDITGDKELEGAKLSLYDKDNNLIETWTSKKEAHIIRGLELNKEYRLHEDQAPIGYATTSDITFTVDESGKPTKVVMKDEITKVEVSKIDAASKEHLKGADMVVYEKDSKKEVAKWTSDGKVYLIEGLEVGKTYILHEAKAPSNYKVAEDLEFKVKDTEEIQMIIMKDERKPVQSVQTGDQTMLLPIISVLLGSGIAAIILYRKSKKDK